MKAKTIGIQFYRAEHGITTEQYSHTIKLVLGSVLGAIAALLQAAGLFAGIGYVFSMMATGPIVLATILSIRIGLITYIVTTLLLVIIQPTEVLIFLFTTGILGLGLGLGFKLLRKKLLVTLTGMITLAIGIMSLLFLFQFPVLGPTVGTDANISMALGILFFCYIYSWIWMRVSLLIMRRMEKQYGSISKGT